MALKKAPYVNGIVEGLSEEEILSIQEKLQAIQAEFDPTDEQPTCDTFYLVVTYVKNHSSDTDFILINGDTAEHCLAYVKEESVVE
jgi:hypothetical protein